MPSIIPKYEYDIFISYRHKDNKTGWVTEFVQSLKNEIEATFKEDISIYFDSNPHDGLHETHDVDGSLKEKVKCLVFVPIVSQTYCDPNAFAWQKEFLAFLDFAKTDSFGLDVKLAGGNVAKRVLPIRIHEIDSEDQNLFEDQIDGVMRPIDFIYKTSGVNRPLTPNDPPEKNLNQIFYKDQINKTANAIKDVLYALKNFTESVKVLPGEVTDAKLDLGTEVKPKRRKTSRLKRSTLRIKQPGVKDIIILGLVLVLIYALINPNFFKKEQTSNGESKKPVQLELVLPEEIPISLVGASASEFDQFSSLAISPDGSVLCFVGDQNGRSQLFLRYLDNPEIIPIKGTENAVFPFFSPDGRWVAFGTGQEFGATGRLKKVLIPDGNPIDISRFFMRGGAVWTSNDEIISPSFSGLYKVPSTGGDPVMIDSLGIDVLSLHLSQTSLSPDEKYLIYNDYRGDIYRREIESGKRDLIYSAGGGSPFYLPTGHLTFLKGNALFAVPFDLEKMKKLGPENIIVNEIRGTRNGPHLTYSNNGTLIYVSGGYNQKSTFSWINKDGKLDKINVESGNYGSFDLSPDENLVAFGMLPGQDFLLIYDLRNDRKIQVRVPGALQLYSPVWGPDSQSIIFGVRTEDNFDLYFKNIFEVGEAIKLTIKNSVDIEQWPYAWSPDGNFITVQNNVYRVDQEGYKLDFVSRIVNGNHMALSPNEKFIVYGSAESGASEIYVQPFPASGQKWQISTEGGTDPIWSNDGTRIYYHNNFKIYSSVVNTQGGFRFEPSIVYYEGPFLNAVSRSLSSGGDHEKLLILEPIRESQVTNKATVILNWFDEVKRLAPVSNN